MRCLTNARQKVEVWKVCSKLLQCHCQNFDRLLWMKAHACLYIHLPLEQSKVVMRMMREWDESTKCMVRFRAKYWMQIISLNANMKASDSCVILQLIRWVFLLEEKWYSIQIIWLRILVKHFLCRSNNSPLSFPSNKGVLRITQSDN
jgi:hypothetical protein